MVAPNINAKSIPDVWDGYYRITLVQFVTMSSPEQLRKQFESFRPTISDVQMQELVFQTRKIDIATRHFQLGNDFTNEPIALYVSHPSEFEFESDLRRIRDQVNPSQWTQIHKRFLHMNIPLYSNTTERNWTWKEIKQHDIPAKVGKHPIEFHRTLLQIIPSRETCKRVYGKTLGNPWWMGVTELEGKCSGCQYPVQNQWKGVCSSCHQYERIKPIWSSSCGQDTANVSNDLDSLCSNYESKLQLS
ncbi:unnamed protein product [Adineta steineri]|uniref:Uncharacterized protein n=1 Tax=Adineta steineri TaxID=433720 RepID=A0A814WCJ0_9BILA|nr:unnamed protein product [Adineta steineri]CAF1470791.1 unnamed protein product [Adineta steineri]